MDASERLYLQFTELYMQNLNLTERMTKPVLEDYTITESHLIQKIQELKDPNTTKLALNMHISKGAVCKNIKKLQTKGDVDSYMKASNKKEIYYRLTPKGLDVYNEHNIRRSKSVERDIQFFRSLPQTQVEVVSDFLDQFLKYLSSCTAMDNGADEE